MSVEKTLLATAAERILVLDGAMGTMIQDYKLDEAGYRGARFDAWNREVRGNNDLLNLSQPKAVRDIHLAYFRAGADIVSTNTFSSTSIAQADYGMQEIAYELNFEGARLVRAAAITAENEDGRKRFVAGALGPTNRTASISPDVSNPGFRAITFDQLREAYARAGARTARRRRRSAADRDDLRHAQRQGGDLRDPRRDRGARRARAGDDLRHDHRPVRAACCRARRRARSGIRSATRRRSRSGSTARSAPRKCARMSRSSRASPARWSAPIRMPACRTSSGCTTRARNSWPGLLAEFARAGLVNIVGGCCGTTPAHIRAIADAVKDKPPRKIPAIEPLLRLSGLEPFALTAGNPFVNVGERTNVTGSAKFRKLITAGDYNAALAVARDQVENGAQVIDVNMDEGLLEREQAMVTFLNLIASEPDIARVPVMVDSLQVRHHRGRPEMRAGQGGREFDLDEGRRGGVHQARQDRAPLRRRGRRDGVRRAGPGRHVRAQDRDLQARLRHPGGSGRLPARRHHLRSEHLRGRDRHRGAQRLRRRLHRGGALDQGEPARRAHSGGVSNLSFAFRGNEPVREAMHSVFLYHAIKAGMDMGIVNAGQMAVYDDLDPELREACEDVVLNRRDDAAERLLAIAQRFRRQGQGGQGSRSRLARMAGRQAAQPCAGARHHRLHR